MCILTQVFEVHSGRLLNRLQGGHSDSVHAVVLGSDGKVFTGGNDGQVLCWSPRLQSF